MKNGILVVVSLLAALALAELGARLLLSVSGAEPMVPLQVGRPDATLGWSLSPNTDATSNWGAREVAYRINAQGVRGDEVAFDKPAEVFRIVVVGDSVTFGAGVPLREHFSGLLGGYFERVEVINIAVSGFGVDQELLRLRALGLRYQPDLVIAQVDHYANQRHMHAVRWGKSKPQFALRDGALVQVAEPQVASGPLFDLHLWLRQWSVAYQIGSEIVEAVRSGESAAAQDAADAQRLQDPAFVERMHALGAAIVAEMAAEARAAGAHFLLVTRVASLVERMQARDVDVLDMRRAWRNPDLTLAGDPHPDGAANGILAWELAQYLVARDMLAPQHRKADE